MLIFGAGTFNCGIVLFENILSLFHYFMAYMKDCHMKGIFMLHQLLTYTFLFFLSSCAFFTAMKEQVSLTKEDKVVLEEFYHKGKIKRETFICKDKSNQDEAYCGYYKTIRNFCHDKKISQSSCESHSLGKLLCMSLDAKTGFCGDVSVPQALCMLSGKSRLICEGVDFKKAL